MNVIFCPSSGSPVRTTISSFKDFGKFTTAFDYVYAMQIQLVLPTSLSETSSFTTLEEPTSSPSNPSDENPDNGNILEISSAEKGKAGLGEGAIAGVVVGAVAALLLAGAAIFLWRRRKHRHMPVSKGSPGAE